MECLGNYACYQAFVPCMARGVLLEKLDETGMRKFTMRSSFLLSLLWIPWKNGEFPLKVKNLKVMAKS